MTLEKSCEVGILQILKMLSQERNTWKLGNNLSETLKVQVVNS